jgi:hypothetical protein
MPDAETLRLIKELHTQQADILTALRQVPSHAAAAQQAALRCEDAATRTEGAADRIALHVDQLITAVRREGATTAKFLDEWAKSTAADMDRRSDQRLTKLEGTVGALAKVVEDFVNQTARELEKVRRGVAGGFDLGKSHAAGNHGELGADDDAFTSAEPATSG